MKKRILPALLALCMVMALLPATVFAACSNETQGHDKENCTCTNCTESNHSTECFVCTPCDGSAGSASCSNTSADKTQHKSACRKSCTGADGCTSTNHADGCPEADQGGGVGGGEEEVTECPTCGCSYDSCTKCKPAVEADAENGIEASAAVCNCATTPCGAAGCKYGKCTNRLCTDYDKVVNTATHEHTVATACAAGQNTNSILTSCTNSNNHQADCAFACGVNGCTKDKNHPGAHTNTTVCTKDDHCGVVAEGNHQMGCPIGDAALEASKNDNSGELKTVTGEEYVLADKVCTGANHEQVEGKTDNKFDVKLTISYQYYEVMKADDADPTKKVVDADATATAKTAAQTKAQNAAKAEWEAAHDPVVCDVCAKAADNAELAKCTMAADCPANGVHRKGCLSQCTHNDNCKNAIGNPAAHTVWYKVVKTTVRGEGLSNQVDTLSTYETYEAAVAEVAALRDANDDTAITFAVVANHCPKAGVADSTVLGGDDDTTTTDPTTPEVKAPEKADDFADLDGTEWYAEELTSLVEKGIFTGSLDNGKYSFNATSNVTGAELVVLLSRVAGEDLVTTGATWAAEATAWASEAGYTEGLDITTTGALTRQDVILVLWRAAGSPDSEQSLEAFPDAEGLEGEYLTAMKWAVEKEIIKGDGDTGEIKADANITRAEIVSVLARYDNVK